jgi:5-formyltetrahydrofolate cyclo-ligase
MGTDEGALRKATLREQLTARRKALSAELVDTRGLKIQARFLATPYYHHAQTVALYAPIRGEVPTRDILTAGLADGKVICYPLSHVRGRVLSFRAVRSESELEPGRLGVREPADAAELIAVEQIDLFVVPGLGFTPGRQATGARRRLLRRHPEGGRHLQPAVGLAFAEQIVDDLPTNEDDVDVDLVVTENEVFRGLARPPISPPRDRPVHGGCGGQTRGARRPYPLPRLIARHEVDLVIANAENSEGGAGISGESAEALLGAQVNLLTSGNHFWTKRQILPWVEGPSRASPPTRELSRGQPRAWPRHHPDSGREEAGRPQPRGSGVHEVAR